jgi:hypothetical protein
MPIKRKTGNPREPVLTEDQKRFVASMQAAFSGENLLTYLKDDPERVTKLLAGAFRGNNLTDAEREAIAQRLATARNPVNGGLPPNGGLPKIPA